MKTLTSALAFAALVGAADAATFPPIEIDFASPDVLTFDAGEGKLPPGEYCLVFSVRNNPGEPRTLTYLRGKHDWCDPEDRVVVKRKRERK